MKYGDTLNAFNYISLKNLLNISFLSEFRSWILGSHDALTNPTVSRCVQVIDANLLSLEKHHTTLCLITTYPDQGFCNFTNFVPVH